jgi:GNAT superfamily N-acetyltransferase
MSDTPDYGYRIEQAAFDAWPAARTLVHNRWVARLSSGYTGRANSVTPQGALETAFEEQVAYCESLFFAEGLPPLFRLTTIEDYSALDEFLRSRGYAHTSATLVMAATCAGVPTEHLRAMTVDEWLPHYDRFSERVNTRAHREILERIAPPRLLAGLESDGQLAGVGLAVAQSELVGLFDIVISPGNRGKGLGSTLVNGMLAWGRENGAERAYLQVTEANLVARRVYEKLGFRELYRYHYRKK